MIYGDFITSNIFLEELTEDKLQELTTKEYLRLRNNIKDVNLLLARIEHEEIINNTL